jgi:AbrB family looped-hinge helix DNA binding protein
MSAIGQVTVNASGDVAIPKSICEQAGLRPGASLIVEKNGAGEIRLRQTENGTAEDAPDEMVTDGEVELIKENGFWVIRGVPAEALENIVEREREARINELIRRVLHPEGDSVESVD